MQEKMIMAYPFVTEQNRRPGLFRLNSTSSCHVAVPASLEPARRTSEYAIGKEDDYVPAEDCATRPERAVKL